MSTRERQNLITPETEQTPEPTKESPEEFSEGLTQETQREVAALSKNIESSEMREIPKQAGQIAALEQDTIGVIEEAEQEEVQAKFIPPPDGLNLPIEGSTETKAQPLETKYNPNVIPEAERGQLLERLKGLDPEYTDDLLQSLGRKYPGFLIE